MKTEYENKSLKLNTALRGHSAGSVIRIKTTLVSRNVLDEKGEKVVKVVKDVVPVDPYWRNRVKDSVHDKCCEFVKVDKTKK